MERVFGVLFSVWRGAPNQGEWVVACLEGAWPKILGERLAAVSAPVYFDGSTLVIEIKDPQWEEAFGSVQSTVLEKLRCATAGEIKKIKIVGRWTGEHQS